MDHRALYELRVEWFERKQTLGEFVDGATVFLKELQSLHPLFKRPQFLRPVGGKKSQAVEPNFANLLSLVSRFGWDKQSDPWKTTGVLPDGTMSCEGTCHLGFRISLGSFPSMIGPKDFSLTLRGGAFGDAVLSGGSFYLTLPCEGWSEFEDVHFAKRLFEVAVRHFDPVDGKLRSMNFIRAQGADPPHTAIGWMNYWADPAVLQDMPAEAECESFGPGGVLLTLQARRPEPDDAEAVAKAVAIRSALMPGQWFEPRRPLRTEPAT
jgi:hypothetical protein